MRSANQQRTLPTGLPQAILVWWPSAVPPAARPSACSCLHSTTSPAMGCCPTSLPWSAVRERQRGPGLAASHHRTALRTRCAFSPGAESGGARLLNGSAPLPHQLLCRGHLSGNPGKGPARGKPADLPYPAGPEYRASVQGQTARYRHATPESQLSRPHTASLRATTDGNLFMLAQGDFQKALRDRPQCAAAMSRGLWIVGDPVPHDLLSSAMGIKRSHPISRIRTARAACIVYHVIQRL
jgi:hypothetical protein